MNKEKQEKILLVLLPFWDPQIPPVGLACLKSVLQQHGYQVTAVDANVEGKFRGIYDRYFNALKKYIPQEKRGNLYKIGHEVFRNHLMAHIHRGPGKENQYPEIVKILVYQTFYWQIHHDQVLELVGIIGDFYSRLEDYFLDLLHKENPTVLGLSVFSGTLPASLFAFKLARQRYPQIKTIMGGGIFADQLALNSPDLEYFQEVTKDYIDKMIIGEGELLFLKYLQKQLPGSQRVYSVKDINGEYVDLAVLPGPDFSDFDLQHYFNLAAYGSRSCPFQCSFCSEATLWGKFRKKPPNQVAEEMIHLSQTHGFQLFLMGDCLLNPIISDLSSELIRLDTAVYWDGYWRVDPHVCDEETALLWRRGGFYRARIGCESGSPRVLQLMGKKITPQQIKSAVSNLARIGIKTTTMWVVGHPGETEADFLQTLNLVEELKDDIYEADCTPFYFFLSGQPGSLQWQEKNQAVPLYPETAKEMLLVQTWIIAGEPSREERYQRLNRFIRHIQRLGIPNPYSLHEIYQADQRWKQLQKNAVPPLLEFKRGSHAFIDECKHVHQLFLAKNKKLQDLSFGF